MANASRNNKKIRKAVVIIGKLSSDIQFVPQRIVYLLKDT